MYEKLTQVFVPESGPVLVDSTYHWDIDPIYTSRDILRISVISEIILWNFVSEAHWEAILEIPTASL